jgi:hypothetical protein
VTNSNPALETDRRRRDAWNRGTKSSWEPSNVGHLPCAASHLSLRGANTIRSVQYPWAKRDPLRFQRSNLPASPRTWEREFR